MTTNDLIKDFGKVQKYFPGDRPQNDFACRPRCSFYLHESQVAALEIEKPGFIIIAPRKFMFLSSLGCESGGLRLTRPPRQRPARFSRIFFSFHFSFSILSRFNFTFTSRKLDQVHLACRTQFGDF